MVEAYIAIGANIGDRVENIRQALRLMRGVGISILSTGFLYQTDPMYVEDQPMFLNTVCKVETDFEPRTLLTKLQGIEESLGKVKKTVNGPRAIDLDILFYGDAIIDFDDLVVPHPRITERFFVLNPLLDICPNFQHPLLKRSIYQLHTELLSGTVDTSVRVVPTGLPDSVFTLSKKSYLMGILNVTPDSFSDGGRYLDPEHALAHARALIAAGADIIDIGGETTRPNAEAVSAEEELRRVENVIKMIRREFPHIPISIDTYKSETAAAAIGAGASMINDVSGGMIDHKMIDTVARLGVPYFCMHAGKVGSQSVKYNGILPSILTSEMDPKTIVEAVKEHLCQRIVACEKAGIPRWDIILDPGLGFGKTGVANFTIVKHLSDIFSDELSKYPVMIGASRKRFVRDLMQDGTGWTGSEHDAMLGTSAVTVAAIANHDMCFFHRVHDVSDLRRVVDVTDKIYR